MTQPSPPPSEDKKTNSWKIVAIALLVIVVFMGAIIGILWFGQIKQTEYTKNSGKSIISGLQ